MAEAYRSPAPTTTLASNTQRNSKLLVIAAVCIIALITFIFLYRTTQIYLLKSNIFQLERQLVTVNEEYNTISLQVSRKKNPDNIISIAQQQCGLILPSEDQFIAVNARR